MKFKFRKNELIGNIPINDLDKGIARNILQFANDTKI